MNAPVTPPTVPPYHHTPLFPLGPDTTPYRKLDVGGVRVEKVMGKDMLIVEHEAMRALAEAAFNDINHLLRPAHLKQLRKILDDPEASANDKFVAYDFLKNANIAAGGVLPMCQDTGTAIISARRAGWSSPTAPTRRRSPRARATVTSSAICATRSSRRSPCSRRRTPSRTCRRRSRSTPRARTPTSSCSSPKAAARPTSRFCSRRRRRSSPTTA